MPLEPGDQVGLGDHPDQTLTVQHWQAVPALLAEQGQQAFQRVPGVTLTTWRFIT